MTPMEQYIRAYAASIGLNPDVVMRVVLSEGGQQSLQPAGYARQALGTESYGQEESFGPFQMHMRGGLGERALAAGLDPRDPAQAFKVAKFAMDTMKAEGLGHWHGWKGDKWAARAGAGTGEDVAMPEAMALGRYDARRDSPSYARPTGEQVSQYALRNPVGPEGDVVTRDPATISDSPYNLPAAGTTDDPLITQEYENPFTKVGSAVAKLGARPEANVSGGIQTPPNPAMASLPAQGTIDPSSAQRQALMMQIAMQRLNSGQLWPMAGGGQIG